MRLLYLLVLILCVSSCKTIGYLQEDKTTTSTKILGTIGEEKDFLLEQNYKSTAIPEFNEPIQLEVQQEAFCKAANKAFTKAKAYQPAKVTVNYVDSVKTKPKYLKFNIADRVSVIDALNAKENGTIKEFASNKSTPHMVSGISAAFNPAEYNAIVGADEVFLVQTGVKLYALQLFKNKALQQTINFNQGVVFAYSASQFCWQEDSKYQLQIVDMVTDRCTKGTYSNAKRAKKRINYYKF